MEGTIGEIRMFAGNFEPRTWAYCRGQLLSIASNQALFSVLGTTYGGDGVQTFGLPNLAGRVPVGTGHGPGLTNRILGQIGGSENNTMTVSQMPAHNHLVSANNTASGRALLVTPGGNIPAQNGDGSGNYANTTDTTMNPAMIQNSGGSQPVNNMQPFLGMNYIICLLGIYPSRN